jgi:hypothetical protein
MRWLNRNVLGIGLASLFSDWSNEIAYTRIPRLKWVSRLPGWASLKA